MCLSYYPLAATIPPPILGDTLMTAPHILVVDDEPDIRALIREILEDENYRVSIAENGAAARRAWQADQPDLLLLDIWMPDIDGISLLQDRGREIGRAS